MDYHLLPEAISRLERNIQALSNQINGEIPRKAVERGTPTVTLRMCNSSSEDYEVNSDDLQVFLREQEGKYRNRLAELRKIHQTMVDVATGLLKK